MIFHWKMKNDVCVLTEIEKALTNKKENRETFIGSVLGPVYAPKPNTVLVICLVLWSVSLCKIKFIGFTVPQLIQT